MNIERDKKVQANSEKIAELMPIMVMVKDLFSTVIKAVVIAVGGASMLTFAIVKYIT